MRVFVVRCTPWPDDEVFEPVVAAVEAHAAGVEILRPGLMAFPAAGPTAYYGSEACAAERIVDAVAESCDRECMVGIADGMFTAFLASYDGKIVQPGHTRRFLADINISALGRPELSSVLRRLGVYTLGCFAALPPADVADRFGADAAYAHRLARGDDVRPPVARTPAPDLEVSVDCDPPLDNVEVAAFTARALAAQQHRLLAAHGLACSRVDITATTCDGTVVSRTWNHEGTLSSDAIADRLRWQLDGWLTRNGAAASGIAKLNISPQGLMRAGHAQPGLWGDEGEAESRASRALVQVQGLLGTEAVATAVLDGSRTLAGKIRLVPWGRARKEVPSKRRQPWPGSPPEPSPALTSVAGRVVQVRDAAGTSVGVTGRYVLTAEPAAVEWAGSSPLRVVAWAGPWPVEQHWWRQDARRFARIQVRLADDRALLLLLEDGRWFIEGSYD